MSIKCSPLPPALLLAALAGPSLAQNLGGVVPATLPLPLPGSSVMAPNLLRAKNPWNLPVTGTWKFKLTHGRILGGEFLPQNADSSKASSNEGSNQPANAFDDDPTTRWCASNADLPQWLEANLGAVRHVQSLNITWEEPDILYTFKVQGRKERTGPWTTLADVSAGAKSGPVAITPADVRYLRVTISAISGGKWASIREMKIGVEENGQETQWKSMSSDLATQPAAVRDAFANTTFEDKDWDNIPVPSNWEMLGYSIPTYNTVDNTVGLYRRSIIVPANWAGKRVYWHFDGALDGAEIFVNGQKAGYHESGYTAFDVDLTDLIKPGQSNTLAVRVSKTTPSFEADTGDYQSMGGIYRDTSLIAVPQTHISDITISTPLATNYKDATLNTQVQVQGTAGQAVTLTGKLMDSSGKATGVQLTGSGTIGTDGTASVSLSAPVTAPKLWSAEKPNLYYVMLQLSSGGKALENVQQRFGFRQIDIKNNVVLWNGQPIKATGICRHDFWSDKGFALTDTEWNKDLDMMKAANINAVRTSHYNHAARFLELCDEKGMYILDEVPYCWIDDRVKDPAFVPPLLLRARETVARDKNRPCVLAWSLGNENPMGPNSQTVLDLVKKTDPTRPAFVSGENPDSVKGQDWRDNHYPGPDTVSRDASQTNVRWPVNYTEHPHTFYEKDAQDYDPGVSDLWSETLIKTWDKIWPAPNMMGSFIWEWQSQGVADKNDDKTQEFYLGPDHLRQENNKGIVDGYRNPKPELWIVKMAYSKIALGTKSIQVANGRTQIPITNRFSFTDLNELSCRWTAFKGDTKLKSGNLKVSCPPLQSTTASFPAPNGLTSLRLEFFNADGTSAYSANLPVEGLTPTPAPAAMPAGAALTTQDGADTLRVGNGTQEILFDKKTGNIRSWKMGNRDLLVGGPVVNLGEGKEVNERGYFRATAAPITEGAQVNATQGTNGSILVNVTSNVLNGANNNPLGTLTCTYDISPNAEIRVSWKMDWTAGDERLWEAGMKLSVSTNLKKMNWLRDSYFPDYPANHLGEPTGTATTSDVLFHASKRQLHWLTLTDASGFGVALLPQNQPLISRAAPGSSSTTLFASSQVAGPRGLSGSWTDDHGINAKKGQSLTGDFILRAVGSK